eukprot:2196867-Rhodomonas_salina.1
MARGAKRPSGTALSLRCRGRWSRGWCPGVRTLSETRQVLLKHLEVEEVRVRQSGTPLSLRLPTRSTMTESGDTERDCMSVAQTVSLLSGRLKKSSQTQALRAAGRNLEFRLVHRR